MLGATAGRTTLGGEGLQHRDGSSHLVAATVPNCRAYDPAFAGELAIIFDHGARRMLEEGRDEFYYLTVMNENYPHPSIPTAAYEGVIKGIYRYATCGSVAVVHLLGAGAILREVIAAGEWLEREMAISSEIWSVTSYSELAREAAALERECRLSPTAPRKISYLAACLSGDAPIVAASDYVRAVPQMLVSYLPNRRFVVLGTDGFGRSDTRSVLREFFEVDCSSIALAAVQALVDSRRLPSMRLIEAASRLGAVASDPPWQR